MARKVTKKDNRYLAKLVTENRAPCAFCHRDVDDEVTYGKLYVIGDIQCHYFCALLSCCLVQKGPEEEGLFGFMYRDILAELERIKKHKCSYCSRNGANLGCSVGSCRKQFHLPCGRDKNAVSLFYGSYKSFCKAHAPRQKIPDHIMCKARLRMKDDRNNIAKLNDVNSDEDMVCVICYESVNAYPSIDTFWPPCCARDAWFHRSCLQRMALSAGMHYLKCPLCNDKDQFYEAVVSQGYYVPDRDAAWELEQNAFAEIYERPLACAADTCTCPMGREHDADQGMWDIKLCLLCGSVGCHVHCMGASETGRYVCLTCTPAKPHNMQALADTIEKLIIQEQANVTTNHGPVMPSRMSLRRTKGRVACINRPSTSRAHNIKTECESPVQSPNIQASRQELNLKTPRKLIPSDSKSNSPKHSYKSPEKTSPKSESSYKNEAKSPIKLNFSYNPGSYKNRFHDAKILDAKLSPMKLLEQRFREKVVCMGGTAMLDDQQIVDLLRNKFLKPRPLSEKKKIVDEILDGLFSNTQHLKHKEPLREWCSPKKCYDIAEENEMPASNNQPKASKNTVDIQETPRSKITHSTPKKNTKDIKNENDDLGNNKLEESQGNSEGNNSFNTHDDSSNSTFQLPSEFIAELSDNSQSPKRKTIEMKDSSLEIFEQDHSINIDLTKINSKCSFKFSRLDKEKLEEENVGIDLESFKKNYLCEVVGDPMSDKIKNFRDFNIVFDKDKLKSKKRKLSEGNIVKYKNEGKKRKMSENDLNLSGSSDDFEVKKVHTPKNIGNLKKVKRKKAENYRKRLRERESNKNALQHVKKSNENKISEENLDNSQENNGKQNNAKKSEEIKQIRFKNEKIKHNDEVNRMDRKQDKLKAQKLENVNHVKTEKRESKDKIALKRRMNKSKKEIEEKVLKDKYKKSRRDKDKRRSEKIAKDKKKGRNLEIRSKDKKRRTDKNIEVTIDSSENKLNQKTKTKLSISNNEKDISVKIKWKKKQLRLKIESKKDKTERIEKDNSKFKQYVLQYFSEVTPKEVLVKPEKEVSPLRRKYVKQEKTTDNLKQMSIQNFFKVKSPKDNILGQ